VIKNIWRQLMIFTCVPAIAMATTHTFDDADDLNTGATLTAGDTNIFEIAMTTYNSNVFIGTDCRNIFKSSISGGLALNLSHAMNYFPTAVASGAPSISISTGHPLNLRQQLIDTTITYPMTLNGNSEIQLARKCQTSDDPKTYGLVTIDNLTLSKGIDQQILFNLCGDELLTETYIAGPSLLIKDLSLSSYAYDSETNDKIRVLFDPLVGVFNERRVLMMVRNSPNTLDFSHFYVQPLGGDALTASTTTVNLSKILNYTHATNTYTILLGGYASENDVIYNGTANLTGTWSSTGTPSVNAINMFCKDLTVNTTNASWSTPSLANAHNYFYGNIFVNSGILNLQGAGALTFPHMDMGKRIVVASPGNLDLQLQTSDVQIDTPIDLYGQLTLGFNSASHGKVQIERLNVHSGSILYLFVGDNIADKFHINVLDLTGNGGAFPTIKIEGQSAITSPVLTIDSIIGMASPYTMPSFQINDSNTTSWSLTTSSTPTYSASQYIYHYIAIPI
jgi:hypothetical protein